ncbi:unnamed protein product [Rotaria sordida]|uniref:Coiled-coil domain-containing protein n=1 Tax=Rotaria sordida TaxID=392033 RepID=A0A813T0X7_9BILA|nr:unnamed protein product [Rotaria sordida]
MTNYIDLNQTILSSLQSGDEQSSDDEIKTLFSSSPENADADIDTTLASRCYVSTNVQTVYNELLLIRQRLSEENERLKKKSILLNQWEERMRETIEHGWQAHKDKFDSEINIYKEKLNQITKDFKRTNETLQLMREQNNELKRNLNDLRETNEKLIEKTKQADKRSENLIRLNQISEQKIKELEKTIEMNKKLSLNNQNEESIKSIENNNCCRNISIGDHCYEHHSSRNSLIFDTIDLLLLLCTDSKSLRTFLKQLSNDTWFHLFYQLTQQCNDGLGSSINSSNIHLPLTPTFDLKTMEKLGILFEKLSELTENRRLFSKYNFLYIFKEWKQKFVNDSPFLVLNMKSTLLNLEQ